MGTSSADHLMDEPIYYVTTDFSGVGFLLPDAFIPENGTEINRSQVHPDIRAEGRAWLAERVG